MSSLPKISFNGVGAHGGPAFFSDELLDHLAGVLPEFLRSRRWFRAKARTITNVDIHDVIQFASAESCLLVVRVAYQNGGEEDHYLLPLSLANGSEASQANSQAFEPLASVQTGGQEGILYSAFANPKFRNAILAAIANNATFAGRNGQFAAHRLQVPQGSELDLNVSVESSVSRAEQSNTSVIFGQHFILKLFRKVEGGVNPDIEIGAFLTEHGFQNTPAVLGVLEYQDGNGDVYAAGILQKFVPNRGDAWAYTLKALGDFFRQALTLKKQPEDPEETNRIVTDLAGSYLESAKLLGKRTAEMHRVLASSADTSDFAPEPFTEAEGRELQAAMLNQADIAFNLLREKQSSLSGEAAEEARQLLASEERVRERFSTLAERQVGAKQIRFHGDYHLGQVLYTGSDFMIIDFEGEPARPLSERRKKGLALRDVAGMVRSFQYAAHAALFGQVEGLEKYLHESDTIKSWGEAWNAVVSNAYLSGYFESAGQGEFSPADREERTRVLDAFLLYKALYEVAYELNNRPDWVQIPMRGILSIVQ